MEEEKRAQRSMGTPVTKETFEAWKAKFDAEQALLKLEWVNVYGSSCVFYLLCNSQQKNEYYISALLIHLLTSSCSFRILVLFRIRYG